MEVVIIDNNMNVKIVNKSKNELPSYATEGSAGMDLRANLNESIILQPLERKLISTGIFIELPDGYEAQVRPRSGLAVKNGISIVNTPGTIDSDYRGEIKVCLVNLSNKDFIVNNGERIGQIIISKYEKITLIETNELSDTQRGSGGFGHTGK